MVKKGKRKTQDPCETCRLHRDRCICAFIPHLELRTKIALVVHAKELRRTTNTGVLATKALLNSEVIVRGQSRERLDLSSLLTPKYRSLLFFPSATAVELTPEFVRESSLPIQLIVPDGNWRQASKTHIRHPELRDVPHVMVNAPFQESVGLRREPVQEGMSTLRAIAYALGSIEGPEVQAELLELYARKLNQTLLGRGI